MTLKAKMEYQWRKPGVANPCNINRFKPVDHAWRTPREATDFTILMGRYACPPNRRSNRRRK